MRSVPGSTHVRAGAKKFEWTSRPLGPVKLARWKRPDQAEISAVEETSLGSEAYKHRAHTLETLGGADRGQVPRGVPLREAEIDQIDCRNRGVEERNVVVEHLGTGIGLEA